MAETSTIEWTDATWQPITGCSVVSPGCTNCYAMGLAGTRLRNHPSRVGLTRSSKAGPVWTGEVRLNEEWLLQPLAWRRPRKIFVCAHGDLFHEAVPDEWIDRLFAVMALCPQHTFQVLTKRSARMRAYFEGCGEPFGFRGTKWTTMWHRWEATRAALRHVASKGFADRLGQVKQLPLPNIWLGVSTEDQRRADERIPDLLATPAAIRFVSAEPLLGPIDFTRIACPNGCSPPDYCNRCYPDGREATGTFDAFAGGDLDWIIVGGESGPNARPMHPAWARSIRDQCAAAGVAFHFKQWGAWRPSTEAEACGNPRSGWTPYADKISRLPKPEELYPQAGAAFVEHVGKKAAGRLLDGVEHNGMPEARA